MSFLSHANNKTQSSNIITLFVLGISCDVGIDQHNICFCSGIVILKKINYFYFKLIFLCFLF